MSYALKEKSLSSTKKRLDAIVQLKDWLGNTTRSFPVRIVSRVQMEDADIDRAINECINRYDQAEHKSEKSTWAQLTLKTLNGNAYIQKEKNNDDDQS
ncbi:hypothetical protein [Phaeodactylibacter xiamenensis]|uniref:hypothetical protein n=1 Tax=Phaeodactylibacter xiamenensis TaxID=1524460 RepID=UPI0024A9DE58|nr:hypothetical protein [Phaeodactylibacter xiamenensis]